MIKLTKKEIYNLKPVGSNVLIKPNRKIDEIYFSSGSKLYFDPSFHPEMHAPVTGEVIVVPAKTKIESELDFESVVELVPGDNVIFSYIAGSASLDPRIEETIVDEEKELYFWIRYQDIYAAKRGDYRFAINHYHIVEEVDEVKPESILELPDSFKKKSNKIAKVLFRPTHHVRYKNDRLSHGAIAPEGSYIVVDKNGIFPLEHDLHRSFMGRTYLPCVVAQRDVMAIIPAELIDKIK